jgi:hypothetical protein
MTATATMLVQSNVVIALADALARNRNGRGHEPLLQPRLIARHYS